MLHRLLVCAVNQVSKHPYDFEQYIISLLRPMVIASINTSRQYLQLPNETQRHQVTIDCLDVLASERIAFLAAPLLLMLRVICPWMLAGCSGRVIKNFAQLQEKTMCEKFLDLVATLANTRKEDYASHVRLNYY